MKELLTTDNTRALETLPSVESLSHTTTFSPTYVSRTQPDKGWCWLSHEQLKRVETFLKKSRPSVRSVLLAYAQLSSRNGNALSFPAAARLVADLAGVAVSTLHEADAKLVAAGLVQIRQRKDARGLDAPRMVTLCDELPEVGPVAWELVSADELARNAAGTRRRRSDSGVRLGKAPLRQSGHTKETSKQNSKETFSLTATRTSYTAPTGRENWAEVAKGLAKEHDVPVELVERMREKHAAGLANLTTGAYQTPRNFANALPSLLASNKGKTTSKPRPDLVAKAQAERVRWWKQADMAGTWEDANDAQRRQFMTTKQGASFLAMAENWADVCEETGRVSSRATKQAQGEQGGIRNRKDLLYDGTGDW